MDHQHRIAGLIAAAQDGGGTLEEQIMDLLVAAAALTGQHRTVNGTGGALALALPCAVICAEGWFAWERAQNEAARLLLIRRAETDPDPGTGTGRVQ